MATNTTADLKGLFPDQTFNPADVIPESLIIKVGTPAGVIEGDAPVIRVPYVKEDPTIGFVAEGAEIPLGDADLDEITIHTHKLALLSKMSREASTYTTAEGLVSTSMARAVTTQADLYFLTYATDPRGLISTPGLVDAGEVTTTLDTITDAITAIEANGGTATSIIMDPRSWGYLSKLKTADTSAQPLLGSPSAAPGRVLFGLPVHTTAQMTPGTALVVDDSNILTATSNLELAKSDQAYFTSDSIAYRVTMRIGWGLIRANRLAKFTIPTVIAEAPAGRFMAPTDAPEATAEPVNSEPDFTKPASRKAA